MRDAPSQPSTPGMEEGERRGGAGEEEEAEDTVICRGSRIDEARDCRSRCFKKGRGVSGETVGRGSFLVSGWALGKGSLTSQSRPRRSIYRARGEKTKNAWGIQVYGVAFPGVWESRLLATQPKVRYTGRGLVRGCSLFVFWQWGPGALGCCRDKDAGRLYLIASHEEETPVGNGMQGGRMAERNKGELKGWKRRKASGTVCNSNA
ncbi:hypothetical protein VTK56DRAFT_10056 [Thermocarpiscus australiensis]